MAVWSSALDFGVHPVPGYDYKGHIFVDRARHNRIMVRVRVRVRFRSRVRVRDKGRAKFTGLESGL